MLDLEFTMREGDMSKGYFLSEVDVANPEAYEAYRTRVLPSVEKFGGRFLVRGGEPKTIEGGGFACRSSSSSLTVQNK
jgi:uncharacterized protein (DUF1330 family)